MTLIELRAFGRWMVRKTIRLPLVLLSSLRQTIEYVARTVYDDGVIGIVLGALVTCLAGLVGLVCGGIYEESTKPVGTVISIEQVGAYFGYPFIVTAVTLTIYTCWLFFKEEQTELFNKLKGH